MRIGIYDPYLDDLGGGEKYMMSIALALGEKHNVDVFWDKEEDFAALQKRFGLHLSKIKLVANCFTPETSLLQRFFLTKKYDVIIFLTDGSIPFVGSKKLFLHIQQPLVKMQTKSFLDKLKLSRVSAFFCNSEYTRSYISNRFALKTLVIYPPVYLHPQHISKKNMILHVGRFRLVDPLTQAGDYKKQHIMLQAFADMVKKGLTGWKFTLAVSVMDKEQEAFEQMKKNAHGLPVEFFVNKTNDELWELYSQAKIYWHASGYGEDLSKHPEYAEHFGISTVEAMGAGAVPVVINAGGQKEIVTDGENGLLWDTLDELKEKTLTLTKDHKRLEILSQHAKIRAKDFSYERFAQEVEQMVQ